MLFAAIHGVVMMVASIAVIPSFLRLYTDSAEVLEMGLSYAYVAFFLLDCNLSEPGL